jgi:lipoate synthase
LPPYRAVKNQFERPAAWGMPQNLNLGQYLQPSSDQLPVERFIPPDEFDAWKIEARAMGFSQVASGPFVRSSYHAKELSALSLGP